MHGASIPSVLTARLRRDGWGRAIRVLAPLGALVELYYEARYSTRPVDETRLDALSREVVHPPPPAPVTAEPTMRSP